MQTYHYSDGDLRFRVQQRGRSFCWSMQGAEELDAQLEFGHRAISVKETLGYWSVFVTRPTATMAYDVDVVLLLLKRCFTVREMRWVLIGKWRYNREDGKEACSRTWKNFVHVYHRWDCARR